MKVGRKGFTLVELLAVIIILAVIMLIAVPNVMTIIDNSKKETYITDAKMLIASARNFVISNTAVSKPGTNELVMIYLNVIPSNDLTTDPEGYEYKQDLSFVVLENVNGYDKYWVHLVGVDGTNRRGVEFASEDNLNSDTRYAFVVKDLVAEMSQGTVAGRLSKTVSKVYKK